MNILIRIYIDATRRTAAPKKGKSQAATKPARKVHARITTAARTDVLGLANTTNTTNNPGPPNSSTAQHLAQQQM